MQKRDVTAAILQGSGALAAVAAAWSISLTAGLFALSIALVVFGVAEERRS